jgi:hypothetical protein
VKKIEAASKSPTKKTEENAGNAADPETVENEPVG